MPRTDPNRHHRARVLQAVGGAPPRAPHRLERLAGAITRFAGSSTAALLAFGSVAVWAATGPYFHYGESWQLVINTGTTIVTFLMVFLIQRSQNKDSLAIHLKLNEIVAALGGASNRLVTAEELGEQELETLHRHYRHLARDLSRDDPLGAHSVDEPARRRTAHPRRLKRPRRQQRVR